MKLRTLRIQNFLSIDDETLLFDENGVHHIIGKNNIGKSAALNAINIFFNNIPQTEVATFLRDGKATFKLHGTFYDGNEVTLSRGATDYYAWTVTGQEGRLDKTKGKVPEILQTYYRLYTDRERTKECLNIRLPRDVLTFVDTTKSENDYLLQKALRTEEFILASQKAEARKRELSGEQKQVRQYLAQETERTGILENQLVDMKSKQTVLQEHLAIIEQEYEMFLQIEQIVTTAQQLMAYDEEVQRLTNGLDMERGEQLKQDIGDILAIEQALQVYANAAQNRAVILQLRERAQALEEIQQAIGEYKAVETVLNSAKEMVSAKRQVEQQKQVVAQSDKRYNDFMVENKFCPIVMQSLDKRCPFGQAVS